MADLVLLGSQRIDAPAFRWRTRLEGSFWGFRLYWLTRAGRGLTSSGQAGRWILDIKTTAGTPVVLGMGVVVDVDMLAPVPGELGTDRPPGQLYAVDDSGLGRVPTRLGWLGDFRLIYRPLADKLAAAGTENEIR